MLLAYSISCYSITPQELDDLFERPGYDFSHIDPHIQVVNSLKAANEHAFKQRVRNRIIWGGHHAQEAFLHCIQQEDPECIKNIPVGSDADVLRGDSLRAITKELADKPYLKNRIAMMQALIEKVGNAQEWYKRYHFNITNLDYSPLLESAIGLNDEELFDFILAAGIHPDAIKDKRGETPLFKAITFERVEMLKKLIAYGADVTVQGDHLQTPLHWASYIASKKTKIIDELMKAGADVNAQNKWGETPLRIAVDNQLSVHRDSSIETIKTLLEHGAWVNKGVGTKRSLIEYAKGCAQHACKNKEEWIVQTGNWPWATDPCQKLNEAISLMEAYKHTDER